MDPSLLPSSWSGGGGDMNPKSPGGGADGDRKRLGAVILLTWRNHRLPSPTRINLEEPARVTQPNQD
jgi:hypothetical protein